MAAMDPLSALAALAAAASEAKIIPEVELPIEEPVAAYSSSIAQPIPSYTHIHTSSAPQAPQSMHLDVQPVRQCTPRHGFDDPEDLEPRPSLAKYMASLGKGEFCRARKPKPNPVVETSLAVMRGRRPVVTPQLKSISDVSDSESSSSNFRPRRKSAKAARNYLQRVMHTQFGDVQEVKNQLPAPAPAPDSSVGNPTRKRSLSPQPEDANKKRKELPPKKPAKNGTTKRPATKEKAERKPSRARVVSNESSKTSSPLSANEKENADDDVDNQSSDHSESEDIADVSLVSADLLSEGSRVLIDYRNCLYKATVRKSRIKDEKHEYLIHYDGNKKSNVHWTPISKIREVLPKEKVPIAKAKPKPNRKPAATSKRTPQTTAKVTPVETADVVPSTKAPSVGTNSRRRTTSQRRASQQSREEGIEKAAEVSKERDSTSIKSSRKAAAKWRRTSKSSVEEDAKSTPDNAVKAEEEEEKKEEEEEGEEEEEEEEEEFPAGSFVYVEYRDILYSATVLNKRQRKGATQFLVHYDGYKKASNAWVKESAIHKRTSATSRRFNKQRKDLSVTKQRAAPRAKPSKPPAPASKQTSFHPKKNGRVKESTTSEESDSSSEGERSTLDMGSMNAGVEFLPGSCVFVQWGNALYLAKMLKRRRRAGETEYFVHYNGYRDRENAWVKLSDVYEINPKSRKIFENKDTKQSRNKASEEVMKKVPARKRPISRSSSTGSKEGGNMDGIAAGVPFLPGSTLFAKVKNSLHLAKMIKKRGDGDMMEYMVQYVNKKRNANAWVPVSMVYEINPQTKRIFNKQTN